MNFVNYKEQCGMGEREKVAELEAGSSRLTEAAVERQWWWLAACWDTTFGSRWAWGEELIRAFP